MKRLIALLTIIATVSVFALLPRGVSAATSVGIGGSASMVNTGGLLNFTGFNSNVVVDKDTGSFSGYSWSSDLGWVNFTGVSVSLSTGSVTGSATVLNTGGLIDFTNFNSNVTINLETGQFSGFGWSADLGWINFGNVLSAETLVETGSPAILPIVLGGLFLLGTFAWRRTGRR